MVKNLFTSTLYSTLGFSNEQVQVLVEDLLDTHDTIMNWNFADIRNGCPSKAMIHVIYGCLYFVYIKIKVFLALSWCVYDMTMRGKNID